MFKLKPAHDICGSVRIAYRRWFWRRAVVVRESAPLRIPAGTECTFRYFLHLDITFDAVTLSGNYGDFT